MVVSDDDETTRQIKRMLLWTATVGRPGAVGVYLRFSGRYTMLEAVQYDVVLGGEEVTSSRSGTSIISTGSPLFFFFLLWCMMSWQSRGLLDVFEY